MPAPRRRVCPVTRREADANRRTIRHRRTRVNTTHPTLRVLTPEEITERILGNWNFPSAQSIIAPPPVPDQTPNSPSPLLTPGRFHGASSPTLDIIEFPVATTSGSPPPHLDSLLTAESIPPSPEFILPSPFDSEFEEDTSPESPSGIHEEETIPFVDNLHEELNVDDILTIEEQNQVLDSILAAFNSGPVEQENNIPQHISQELTFADLINEILDDEDFLDDED